MLQKQIAQKMKSENCKRLPTAKRFRETKDVKTIQKKNKIEQRLHCLLLVNSSFVRRLEAGEKRQNSLQTLTKQVLYEYQKC